MTETDPSTSIRMSKQKAKDSAPELALRRELRRRSQGYRVEWPVPGSLRRRCDIAFIVGKVAVFLDGCFWRSCPDHGMISANNRDWWIEELHRNVERDAETDALLETIDWLSVRIWEHETADEVTNRRLVGSRRQ